MSPKKGSNLRRKHSLYVYCDKDQKRNTGCSEEGPEKPVSILLPAIFDYMPRTKAERKSRKSEKRLHYRGPNFRMAIKAS